MRYGAGDFDTVATPNKYDETRLKRNALANHRECFSYGRNTPQDHGGHRFFRRFELVRSRFRAHRLFRYKFF